MYSRQETAQLKKEFWTAFGNYMKPVPSAGGEKVNWLNYKTGEKDVFFKMDAGNGFALIAIEIVHQDLEMQQLYFEQFVQLKTMLHQSLGEEWDWILHQTNESHKTVSRIYTELQGVSIFRKEDWPALISFFKPRIIALDEFWSSAKYGFEALH